ncbi:MAG: hypothetical protein RLZ87_753, partial [Armatimonadota bacterium]
ISGDKASMPMTERFYSVNGQMMGYESGGVKKDFLTDHLGSITAEIDQTQTRTYDTRYSAYGRNNWSTGTGCGFGWVGSYGYRETGLFHMSHYVRARHYSYVTGGWSTVDPLWPRDASYGYVRGRTTKLKDPTGLGSNFGPCTVYRCSEHSMFGTPIASHKFICVRGPHGGCSGGIYPTGGPFGGGYIDNLNAKCPPDDKDNPNNVTCEILSTDCDIAREVCAQIRRDIKNPPPYWFIPIPVPGQGENCFSYPAKVLCKACDNLPLFSVEYFLCQYQCSLATATGGLPI